MIRRAALVERFLLPLVEGGEVRVGAPLGATGLARLVEEAHDSEPERRLSSARWAVAAEYLVHAEPPALDEDSLRIGIALHDLLFLQHPDAPEAGRGERHRKVAAGSAALLAAIADTTDPATLVGRHSLLHLLPQLHRTDVRISFWVGKREFRGQQPPARLTAWPKVRRVTEERWRVGCLAEAAADVQGGLDAVRALFRASPLTDLLDPLRVEPAFDLVGLLGPSAPRGAGFARVLADPEVCRLVAYRWLDEGIERTGGVFAAALCKRLGQRESRDLRFALTLLAHLHLCLLVAGERVASEALRAAARGEAEQRDFFGLYAALHKTAPARAVPPDARRDPQLTALIEHHVAACATTCGAARTRELTGLVARTLTITENLAA